ncbi:MAG: hypothetical protein Q9185_005012 [Variospora sp. 1 TL-2023]
MTGLYNPTKTPLTSRETELLIIAFQCLEDGDIKIDYDKFAKMAEYEKRKTAVTILGGLIKRKISSSTVDSFSVVANSKAGGNGAGGSPIKKRAAAAAAAPKKPKASTTKDNQDDSIVGQGAVPKKTTTTPTKKRGSVGQGDAEPVRKLVKQSSSVKVEEEEEQRGGEETDEGGEIVKQEGDGEGGTFEA